MTCQDPTDSSRANRRTFMTTAAAVGSTLALTRPAMAVHSGGNERIKIGLVGCGGRGTGAAVQALTADPDTELVAVGDVFEDQLDKSLSNLRQSNVADRVNVDADHRFAGFESYKGVIAASDVVLLATPPHFRPLHFKACVEAGKHTFVEKPVAVDAPGVRSILESNELAKKKNIAVVSGLCWRYETGMQQTIARIHDGALGDIVSLESTRYGGGVGKLARRIPEWTDMQYQMRNWYYYTWLSGDFNVEQFVHEMDKISWVMRDQYPVRCYSVGGRQSRTEPEYGHIFDHFSTVFEYASGVKYYAATRHWRGASNEFADHVHGSDGSANLMKFTISGKNAWNWGQRRTVMHQLEHDAMYTALRKGEIINNGDYMAKSTLMGIMARMSAYTGETLTWQQALESTEDLSPPRYAWDQPLPEPPVAVPGATRFV